jgi:hypothetical protein
MSDPETLLGATLDESATPAPGVLAVAVGDGALRVRYTLPRALVEQCPSEDALAWARNLAPATEAYRSLRDDDAKADWVRAKALGADGWNRGIEMDTVARAVLNALNQETAGAEEEDDTVGLKVKFGKRTWLSHSVLALDALVLGAPTESLSLHGTAVRKAVEGLAGCGALFLRDTLWTVDLLDRRSVPRVGAKRVRGE